jgi:exosortase family protein XrtF
MKGRKQVILFIASTIGLYLIWYLVYDLWLMPDARLDRWLNHFTTGTGAKLLSYLGFQADANRAVISLENQNFLRVGNSCNGLEFFVLFSGFIILFPGPWKKKLFFIPAGIFIIFMLNVLRIAVLTINYSFSRHTFDFNHKYTYSFIIYAAIFGMWMIWVNKFSPLNKAFNRMHGPGI